MNTFYLLRHAELSVDKNRIPEKWTLSSEGIKKVFKLAKGRAFENIEVVCSSEDSKDSYNSGEQHCLLM